METLDMPGDIGMKSIPGPRMLSAPAALGARLCPFIYLDSGAETNLITEDFVEVYSKERRDSFGYHKLKKNFSTRFLGMFDKDKPGIAPSAVLLRVPVRLGTPRNMSKREWILTFFVVKQLPGGIG